MKRAGDEPAARLVEPVDHQVLTCGVAEIEGLFTARRRIPGHPTSGQTVQLLSGGADAWRCTPSATNSAPPRPCFRIVRIGAGAAPYSLSR